VNFRAWAAIQRFLLEIHRDVKMKIQLEENLSIFAIKKYFNNTKK
jgi:hypothetical protein